MGVKTYSDSNSETKYNFHRKAGRSIIERRPTFSPDGESILLIVENIVRVYNIQTGDYVRSLETERPVDELVGCQFPEDEDYNLYSCSSCGCVTTWTWENGAVLRDIKLAIPIKTAVLTFDLLDSKECFITALGESKIVHLGTYSVKSGELLHEYKDTKPKYNAMIRIALGWCNGDRFAAITNGTKCIFIQNLNRPHVRTEILNHNKFRVLTVSAHCQDNAVAVTDTLGRVTILRGNLYDYTKVAREVMHWHFLPPMAACFSKQGSYLYSGGMEKVLIKWTTGNLINKANEKSFIPRLPGMVRYIAVNNTHVAVTLTNNSVVIASTQMRVVSTILECGGLSPVVRAIGTSLVYHKPLGALLMGGRTGHLQLFSTTTDKVLYNIDITRMNNIPPARRNLLPLETEVTCAAVSEDGSWLVTSEYRNDGVSYPEEILKFWSLQQKANPFRLNTCVNLSHGGCNVVSLALNNKGEFCVSAGSDQKFRIWKRDTHSGKKLSWSCQTACYYSSGIAQFLSSKVLNNFKNGESYEPDQVVEFPYLKQQKENDIIMKLFNVHKDNSLFNAELFHSNSKRGEFDMGGVAISQDGSLIAAWFGCKLTLWDTHLCSLRTTLSHPALRPKGVHVQFGNHDAAHYLVCTTEQCVAVWSLLSLTVKWLVQLKPTYLTADPFSNKMAITTANNDVFVFSPHNSTPILSRKSLLNPKTGVFKLCTFGASPDDDIRLYVMRNDSEIYCLEPEHREETRLEVMSRRNLPASNFSTLLAEQQLSDVQAPAPATGEVFDMDASGHAALSQFLIASPHMMPPVSLLSTAFLQSMSGQQQPEEPLEDQEDRMDVDSDSSDDEAGDRPKLNGPYAPKATQLWTPNYEGVKEKRLKKILKEPFLDLQTTQIMFGV